MAKINWGEFMPLVDKVEYQHEATPLQCGQAVIAMLSGKTQAQICQMLQNTRETTLKDMLSALDMLGIGYKRERIQVEDKSQLPDVCVLSLETPRCWHWSLYFKGTFYDPEHGILHDFPECNRKYYWEIEHNLC